MTYYAVYSSKNAQTAMHSIFCDAVSGKTFKADAVVVSHVTVPWESGKTFVEVAGPNAKIVELGRYGLGTGLPLDEDRLISQMRRLDLNKQEKTNVMTAHKSTFGSTI